MDDIEIETDDVKTDGFAGVAGVDESSKWKPAERSGPGGIKIYDHYQFGLVFYDRKGLVADQLLGVLRMAGSAGNRFIVDNESDEVLFGVNDDFELFSVRAVPVEETVDEPEPVPVAETADVVAGDKEPGDNAGDDQTDPPEPTPMTDEEIAEANAECRRRDALSHAARVHQGRGAPSGVIVATAEDFERYLSGDADSEDLNFL